MFKRLISLKSLIIGIGILAVMLILGTSGYFIYLANFAPEDLGDYVIPDVFLNPPIAKPEEVKEGEPFQFADPKNLPRRSELYEGGDKAIVAKVERLVKDGNNLFLFVKYADLPIPFLIDGKSWVNSGGSQGGEDINPSELKPGDWVFIVYKVVENELFAVSVILTR